ncbi:hypothetical protein [Pseudomonas aegrilactucae]|uniref:Tetratricopeptide repeat protein n=1 Tax=Pseudomonas aegrilactucae TaxID=2854028 RepID=A0A9Q2XGM4_9PSED|nr:hypothetical protein [Pseudomonas aegrilactucae]MBV6285955.1 hypothetical protein [Pseudomonas aegrilactucae]
MFKSVLVKIVRSNDFLHLLVKKIVRHRAEGRAHFGGKLTAQVNGHAIAPSSLGEFQQLSKLRNYRSAVGLLNGVSLETLGLSDQLLAIRCLYATADGVKADFWVKSLVRKLPELKNVKVDKFSDLVECVRFSGMQYAEKNNLFCILASYLEEHFPEEEAARLKFNVSQFYLKLEFDAAISPLEFVKLTEFSESVVSSCSGVFTLLLSYGYHAEVYNYLGRCLLGGRPNLVLTRLVIKFMPEWFDGRSDVFFDVVTANKSDITLMQTLHARRNERDYFYAAYQQCFDFVYSSFPDLNVARQDAVLNFLLRCDLWDEALSLIDDGAVSDRVLPKMIILGFRYLDLGDHGAALYCFQRVLEEDSSDSLAAGGLRFATPRAGLDMRTILECRSRIGYGIRASGRKGLVKSASEYTTIEAMAGNYLTYYSSKRNQWRWKILGQLLGEKFYSYKLLPDSCPEKELYIIADEGVGDEIRSSQFYGIIQDKYGRVSASCDPRLVNIFSRSYPEINFFPVRRVRKVMATRSDTLNARLTGVHESVSAFFNDDTYAEMQRADYVTFSQNLMFNGFSGHIARPERGGYLQWDRSMCVPPSIGKLKIGILWRSHLMIGMRKLMYLRLEDFAPLTELEGVEVWSIQHSMTEAETQTCRDLGIRLLDDVDLFNDFEATAGCLLGLDLLIGISSVPMELGAALGIETWMLGFSPENYYLRTAGGKTEVDQLTLNSTVVAPLWIDFTEPQEVCVREVFDEVKRRLMPRLASVRAEYQQVAEG